MDSVFSKIIRGEIPCYKIYEDDSNIAFLDVDPCKKGHTLCVPKRQVDKLFDLPEEDYLSLMRFSGLVASAIECVIPCNRVGMAVVGLEVPHAHVHLIPIEKLSDMDFSAKREVLSESEFETVRALISNSIKLR